MERIFPKIQTIYTLFKNYCFKKHPLTLYGMKTDTFFLLFQKNKKYLLSLIME